MLFKIRENRQKYHNIISKAIEDNLYRKERYNLEFSLAVAVCDEDISLHGFEKFTRRTDKFIVLEDYMSCVMLEGVTANSAIKATSNLQTIFQSRYFSKELFIGMVSSSDYDYDETGYNMVKSLLDILEHSLSNNLNHEIVDYYQFELFK